MREDGGFNKDGSNGGGEKWLDFRYILKVEILGFVDRLDEEYEKNKGVNWNDGVISNWDREYLGKGLWGMVNINLNIMSRVINVRKYKDCIGNYKY